MEIFMCNISASIDENRLSKRLTPLFQSSDSGHIGANSVSFVVRIFPDTLGGTRKGIITVPRQAMGQKFLLIYGGKAPQKRIKVLGIPIFFKESNTRGVLARIQRLAHINPPRIRQAAEEAKVAVAALQFGWFCRDDVFSIEWEKRPPYKAELVYVDSERQMVITWYEKDAIRFVKIRTSSIYWAGAALDASGDPAIMFYLNHPPSFEAELPDAELTAQMAKLMIRTRTREKPRRQRLSSFNDDHASIAPHTSLAIRVLCQTAAYVTAFLSLGRLAHTQVDSFLYHTVRRGLFEPAVRQAYTAWLARLPWLVAFQVEALFRSSLLDMREIHRFLRPQIDSVVTKKGVAFASALLRDFRSRVDATSWADEGVAAGKPSLEYLFAAALRELRERPPFLELPTADDEDLFSCLHVTVTPTAIHLDGPFPERSNRVIRRYKANQDCFIRVSFLEETFLAYRFDRNIDGHDLVDRRVKHFLLNGLSDIAGRRFEFLAYSQSALKEHAVWFVKPFREGGRIITAATIIESLGSFRNLEYDQTLMFCPARYAARISQAFTATDSSVSVEAEEILAVLDIVTPDGKYCFTDGVGTISSELAKAIWDELAAKGRRAGRAQTCPKLYQIRFQGSKGMLSVDYKLRGRAIGLRPSMIKFDAPQSLTIEIARAVDRPGKYFLNRPLIMLLEGLGVPYGVFQSLQDAAVRDAQESTNSLEKSARLLDAHGLGASFRITSTLLNLHRLGVKPLAEDTFWQQTMDFAVNHVLRELKHHARIPVPAASGWTLVGVADHHRYLNEGEIFACVDAPNEQGLLYLEGPILISRSPTIHLGDVQIVQAIGRPPPGSPFKRESLRNGVVFSTKGYRPLSTCLGGGDLDGDIYNLTSMVELHPPRLYEPAGYEPSKKKYVDHPSTMRDVADFVAEYICSDTIGIIATNWLIIADQSTEGIFNKDCLLLSGLHSTAVDYPKTGVPVPLEEIPRLESKTKPDWHAPETHNDNEKDYYESNRAIGRLFRSIKLPALKTLARATRLQLRHMEDGHETLQDIIAKFRSKKPKQGNPVLRTVQSRIKKYIPLSVRRVDDGVINTMWRLLLSYTSQLRSMCVANTVSFSRSAMLTEEEALIGTIVANTSQPRRRKDAMSRLREQTTSLVKAIRAVISGDDDTPPKESLERAFVAYKVALIEEDYFGARSFAWVALGEIFDAIRDVEEALQLSTL